MIEALKTARASIPPCSPPFWARNGHLQTLLGYLIPSATLSDKGEEFLIGLENENERIHTTYFKGSTSTVVYLFHGLGGSADSSYMHRTAIIAKSLGHHVFINNHRGCGNGVGLASNAYHSGRSEDLSKVIAFGRNMLPDHFHLAIGFSLSANALLLLSANVRANVLPDAAIAVNGPINLDLASIKLTQGLNQIYDKRFVVELTEYIKMNRPHDLDRLKNVKTLRDFDENLTAPVGGFLSRDNYYETCSAMKYLQDIQIPTVLLTSEDDPFVGVEAYKETKLSPSIVLHIEKMGGHMGYLSSDGIGFERWLDRALKTYVQAFSGNCSRIFS
jgi:predicted alpha/beta-fold hydrolase